jgi:phosphoribosylaminoimidazole (AIR) synthetase
MMAEKKGFNPQLNYRVEKRIQDEYKKTCKENCLDPGALIRQFMLDIIEKYNCKGNAKITVGGEPGNCRKGRMK